MAKIEFKKGDTETHYFHIPATSWSAGGSLFFTAKDSVDDADVDALIDEEFTDSVVDDYTGEDNVAYKRYTMVFAPAVTSSIALGTTKRRKLLGEFTWVDSDGSPKRFPSNDDFIDVIIYASIRTATT